jgi:hypothetical protein
VVLFKDINQVENSVEKPFVCLIEKDMRIRAGGDPSSAEKEKIQVKDLLTGWYLPYLNVLQFTTGIRYIL